MKMVYKSCPVCKNSVPVATKYCGCGHVFFNKKLLNWKPTQSVAADHKVGLNRRRTGRVSRGRPAYYTAGEFENPFRKYATAGNKSHKAQARAGRSKSTGDTPSPVGKRKRGRPRGLGKRKQLKQKTKVKLDKPADSDDLDMYTNNSPEKKFIFEVTLAEINRKLGNEWNGPKTNEQKTPASSTASR